jgi:translocator protein
MANAAGRHGTPRTPAGPSPIFSRAPNPAGSRQGIGVRFSDPAAPGAVNAPWLPNRDDPVTFARAVAPNMSKRYPALLLFLVVTFVAAAVGSAATAGSVAEWYPTLRKPSWNPPSWVFGPVWTLLYVAMAVAAWRVWRRAESGAARATLGLYGAQLALNALWSILFFGLRRPDLALVDVVLLWVLLLVLLVRFARVDRLAVVLWTPYVAWVGFASVLNATIWQLNR